MKYQSQIGIGEICARMNALAKKKSGIDSDRALVDKLAQKEEELNYSLHKKTTGINYDSDLGKDSH